MPGGVRLTFRATQTFAQTSSRSKVRAGGDTGLGLPGRSQKTPPCPRQLCCPQTGSTGREGHGRPKVWAGHGAAWSVCRSVFVRPQTPLTRAVGSFGEAPTLPLPPSEDGDAPPGLRRFFPLCAGVPQKPPRGLGHGRHRPCILQEPFRPPQGKNPPMPPPGSALLYGERPAHVLVPQHSLSPCCVFNVHLLCTETPSPAKASVLVREGREQGGRTDAMIRCVRCR